MILQRGIELHLSPYACYLPTAAEMAHCDRQTIEHGVPSLELMERAGTEACRAILERVKAHGISRPVALILCGPGNNGGDGFVVARLLAQQGVETEVILFSASRYTEELLINLHRFSKDGGKIFVVGSVSEEISSCVQDSKSVEDVVPLIGRSNVVVDALLGTGQKSVARGEMGLFLKTLMTNESTMRTSHSLWCSIDLPTGMNADTGELFEHFFSADLTIALQHLKRGMTQYPARRACGSIVVVDIGIECAKAPRYSLVGEGIYNELTPLFYDQHKKSRGHLLLLAGSHQMPGALTLSSLGAIHAGAGIVTVGFPKGMDTSSLPPEVLRLELSEERGCLCSQSLTSLRDILSTFSAVVIGPGLGRGGEVEMFVREFLELAQSERIQAVIDADALRALPTSQGERVPLTRGAILTPHPGEAAFLLGTTTTEVQKDRFTAAERLLDATKATILLKGAGTIILNEEMGYVSLAGTPHLGTAGSGDVLSGVLGALIGQTGTALMATALGAYLHGKAAEYIFSNQTQGPFPASHLASAVSCVLGEHQRAR